MGGLKLQRHQGVVSAGCTIKLMGTRLETYVFLTDGLLVDSGPSKFQREYASFFQDHRIARAVLTHFHEDHSGNAPWLTKNGIEVMIHHSAIAQCEKQASIPFYRRIFWGPRKAFSPRPVEFQINGRSKVFQVLEVPGHSPDHIAIYDQDEGAMFTGDLFVSPKTKIVMKYESIPQIIKSLKYLLQFDFQTVYCAHAGVVPQGRELVAKKLAYLGELTSRVLELHQKGMGVGDINRKVFPQTPPLTYISGKEWASEHIIRSIVEKADCG